MSETSSKESKSKNLKPKSIMKQKIQKKSQYGVVINQGGQRMVTQASGAVLAEIKRLQRSTKFLFPKTSFCRLVKEISMKYGDFQFQALAIEAIQEAAELFMVGFLADSYQLTRHRNRQTLSNNDMQLLYNLLVDLVPSLQPV